MTTAAFMNVVTSALKDYDANKSLDQFEEDYGCKIVYNEDGNIADVRFENESAKSAFYLKYNGRR